MSKGQSSVRPSELTSVWALGHVRTGSWPNRFGQSDWSRILCLVFEFGFLTITTVRKVWSEPPFRSFPRVRTGGRFCLDCPNAISSNNESLKNAWQISNDANANKVISKFCGSKHIQHDNVVTSSGNKVYVHFFSDMSYAGKGFSATYKSTVASEHLNFVVCSYIWNVVDWLNIINL